MSRYSQRHRRRMQDPEFAAGYWEMDGELRLLAAIDEIRKQMHLTQEEMARRMDAHRVAVSRLLNADHPNPTLDTLSRMFAALGVTAEVRLRRTREGEPPIEVKVDVADDVPA